MSSRNENKIRSQAELTSKLREKNQMDKTQHHQQKQHNSKIKSKQQINQQTKHSNKMKKRLLENEFDTKLADNLVKNEDKLSFLNKISSNQLSVNSKGDDAQVEYAMLKERQFLSRGSYASRTNELDEKSKEFLENSQSLSGSSTNPKHLTILHVKIAEKIGNLLHSKLVNSNNNTNQKLFVEFQPGIGLITQRLLELNKENSKSDFRYILIEPKNKYLEQLQRDLVNTSDQNRINIVKGSPFEENYSKNLKEFISKANLVNKPTDMSVFAILPWNLKGFLSRLYGDFASDRGLFNLDANLKTIDFYFYVNELQLAKLKPDLNKNYQAFNSCLSVLSSVFSECELIDQQDCNYIFPYPLVATPNKFLRYPFNKLNFKQLFLVNLRFKSNDETFMNTVVNSHFLKHKRLFYLFMSQLFVRPINSLHDSLKPLCRNVNVACKHNSLNIYTQVNKISAIKYFKLYEYLISKDMLNIERIKEKNQATLTPNKPTKSKEMKALKLMNKNLSGELVLPDQ